MMKNVFLLLFLISFNIKSFSQDSIPVTVSTQLLWNQSGEWIHLRITDTTTNYIWYDSLADVLINYGFKDTLYLDSGTYKCEVLSIGAAVDMPVITLDNGYIVPWGYPDYQYYLFSVPGGQLTTTSTIWESACNYYISPSSNYTWTTSGTYKDTIPNSIGYDSIITINLTITTIDNSVTQQQTVLTSNEPGATYQWRACNSGNDIFGETNQSYAPIVSGLYSVRVTKNGCEAISSCYSMVVSGVNEHDFHPTVSLFPNPTYDKITIELDQQYQDINIEVKDISGRNILNLAFKNKDRIKINTENLNNGIYFIKINADTEVTILKLLKN